MGRRTASKGSGGPWWVPAAWGMAWAGFGGIWAMFLTMVVNWAGRSPTVLYFVPGCALASGGSVAWVVLKRGGHPLVVRITRYALKAALLVGALLGLIVFCSVGRSGLSGPLQGMTTLAGAVAYGYLGPLALALAGATLRLGWKPAKGFAAAAVAMVYVILGLLFLFPVPPIARDTYNPVGLFFPIWGFGVPFAVVIAGVWRFGERAANDAGDQG